jgi:hypothetical protein
VFDPGMDVNSIFESLFILSDTSCGLTISRPLKPDLSSRP